MSYTYKDNTAAVLSALERAKIRGLKAIGMEAEGNAKEDPRMPVDTGRARNSITFALAGEHANITSYTGDNGEPGGTYSGKADGKLGEAVYLGSNVSYFPEIELGSGKRKGRHVLRNAATEHKDDYKRLMQESMENA